jgi:hypothetical protein
MCPAKNNPYLFSVAAFNVLFNVGVIAGFVSTYCNLEEVN